jgi:hypothetical protein
LLRDVTDNAALYPMMHQIYKEFEHLSPEEKNRMSAAANDLIEDEMEEMEEEASAANVPEFESDPETKKEKPPGIIKRPRPEGSEERRGPRRGVSFDPLALLLDASLEGELELVKRTARYPFFDEFSISFFSIFLVDSFTYIHTYIWYKHGKQCTALGQIFGLKFWTKVSSKSYVQINLSDYYIWTKFMNCTNILNLKTVLSVN